MSLVNRTLPGDGRIEIDSNGHLTIVDEQGRVVSFWRLEDLEIIRDIAAAATALRKVAQS